MQLQTKIYRKENSQKIGGLLKECFKDLFSSHFLSKQLAIRDIKSQYRQSYLGIVWAFIMPITSAFVWVFLNITGTIKLSDTGVPYPIYAFSGTLIWSITKESINSPMAITNAARSVITKINFPKEALILSGIYKLLFNSAIKISLLVVLIFAFGISFHWFLLLFPFSVIVAILFGTALGLFITPISLIYNDIAKMISLVLNLLMYLTPVVYVVPDKGLMKCLMELNPFTPIIATTRDLALGTYPDYLLYFFIIILICVPMLFIGLIFYRISIPIIVERLNA